jgi:tetratricopeptide (TPR) repeat protein
MKKIIWIIAFQFLLSAGYFVSGQTPLKLRDSTIKGPQTFAMVLGISKYKFVRPLAYADKDAELFRDYLKSPGGGSVKDENIFLLTNDKAINSNFWGKGFQWLKAKNLQKGDRLFIYLAGHGDAIDEDQFFFLGYDCNPQGDKNNYLVAGTIQLYNLKKKIANETTRGVDVFFIMDACRSNELPGGKEGQNFLNTAISEKQVGEVIMLATGAGQESLEDVSIGTGHGLFTYYLVDGLNGVADTIGGADQKVTFHEIQAYVDKNVPFVAEQRFKRKQDPFFCCTESSDKVISNVDTAYLQKWLKTKKQQNRGGGNSFFGFLENNIPHTVADTALLETYNRFYAAVKANKLTGQASAEEYFQQLNKKYPGNPYTMDAKSTLAVEYINVAQAKVDRYLGCGDDGNLKEKQANYEAALNLEKAIASVREDDENFAKSLLNRMYFLKASGDFGKDGKNGDMSVAFQNAFAALRIDPNGAYIQNKLAVLHLQNNNKDSALYYANKAVKTAPNWPCAFTTLALVQKALSSNKPDDTKKKPNKPPGGKVHFGIVTGGGISKPSINSTELTFGNFDKYRALGIKGKAKIDLGIISQISLGNSISIRPSVLLSFDQSDIDFEFSPATARPDTITVSVKTTSFAIPIPFIFRFSNKNISPFISAGPTFSYLMQKKDANSENLPVKSFDVQGDIGIGVDIGVSKANIIISPELKYSRGFLDTHDKTGSIYSNVITKFNRQGFTFSVYLRKR